MMKPACAALILITVIALLLRLWRLDVPNNYMFDEVYHVVSAEAYAKNDPAGYEWWHKAPKPGTAYEWLHPPLAKLWQALGIVLFGDRAIGWRIFSALFGTLSIPMLYALTLRAFTDHRMALLAAFLWSIDWLAFVQSRIAMNDIFLAFFVILAAFCMVSFLRAYPKRWLFWGFLSTVSIGLAVSTKWSGVYLVPIALFFLNGKIICESVFTQKTYKILLINIFVLLVPLLLYLTSYGQWWLQGHTWVQFEELHQQIWWYQTNLKATHPYQSQAWMWPLGFRPVWIYVYHDLGSIGNIYATGNPLIWWAGLLSSLMLLIKMWQSRWKSKAWLLGFFAAAYFVFWVPWLFSPRIMFLYHYLPALPFLYVLLAYCLVTSFSRQTAFFFVSTAFLLFLFYLPHLNGLPVPIWLDRLYYWFPSWR